MLPGSSTVPNPITTSRGRSQADASGNPLDEWLDELRISGIIPIQF